MQPFALAAFITTSLLISPTSTAQASKPSAPQTTKPETVKVEKGPFDVILEYQGAFDDTGAFEAAYRPNKYSGPLEVLETAAPGDIEKGQSLVIFDPERIDEQIAQAELDLALARTRLKKQEEEVKRKEEAHAIELESARMAFESAKQTYENFKNVLMPMRLEEAEMGLKSSEDRLEDEEAQFVQLQKMYKSDDLVEETEEIVMRRALRSLEQSRKRMEFTRKRHELTTRIDIPRQLEGYEMAFRRAKNQWELTQATSAIPLEQATRELTKAKLSFERQAKDFDELRADREAMVIRAPMDGVLVHGQLVRGKWSRLDENAKALRPGEKCPSGQVLMTIVRRGPSVVCTSIPESALFQVQEGQEARVTPAADPDREMTSRVSSLMRVSADGQYETCLEVSDSDPRLLPGHTCKIRIATLKLENAITVPSQAILLEDDKHFVHLWANEMATPREVQVGPESEGRTVIEAGLSEGDEVVANPGDAQ